MCVSDCLSVTTFKSQYQQLQNDALQILNAWISLEMLRSKVMASFAYCETHWPCYSNPELVPSITHGYNVVEKPNRVLNTTRNTN